MSDKLYLIPKPNNEPQSIDDYKRQNDLMYKIALLSLGFDGIKLGNWGSDNRNLPYILAGSVIEFDGELYETQNDIELIDECSDDITDRFIVFYKEDDSLKVKIANSNFPSYVSSKRGFYHIDATNGLEKYLRVSFSFEVGLYHSKKYWDKDDINRSDDNSSTGGLTLHSQTFTTVGTHTFDFPLNATSVTFHIMGPGGRAGSSIVIHIGAFSSSMPAPSHSGNKSEIQIEGEVITTCNGGYNGGYTVGAWYESPQYISTYAVGVGGPGGIASGKGTLYDGNAGSNGNTTSLTGGIPPSNTLATGGKGGDATSSMLSSGGSGSCAIVPILRDALGNSNTITIEVGEGVGTGQNGSVYVEWYE